MTRLAVWGLAVLAFVWVVDRVLLWMERSGWINYRRRGLSRSGAAYHGVLLESIFAVPTKKAGAGANTDATWWRTHQRAG